jgi:hypothetical protein
MRTLVRKRIYVQYYLWWRNQSSGSMMWPPQPNETHVYAAKLAMCDRTTKWAQPIMEIVQRNKCSVGRATGGGGGGSYTPHWLVRTLAPHTHDVRWAGPCLPRIGWFNWFVTLVRSFVSFLTVSYGFDCFLLSYLFILLTTDEIARFLKKI